MKASLKLIIVAFLIVLGTAFANAQTKVYSFKSYHLYTCEADENASEGAISLPAKLTINEKAKRIVLYLKNAKGKWVSITTYFTKKEQNRRQTFYECDGKLLWVSVIQERDGYFVDAVHNIFDENSIEWNIWMKYGKLTVQK